MILSSEYTHQFNVPVALFLFNRPNEVQQVFNAISKLKPKTLFLIADGPRADHPRDEELCDQARSITSEVNWDCNVQRLFFSENQSSRNAIPLGLNWVFSKVDQCIILEDDCVPSRSFFDYCAQLLDCYQDDPHIMTIGGHRFDGPDEFNQDSYFFSKYPSTWGWATWKRAWELFDLQMSEWPALKRTDWLENILNNSLYESYWTRIFDQMISGMDAWDYALLFSCWLHKGLSIRPKVNLIHNIGHNVFATHTTQENQLISSRHAKEIEFPLRHPDKIEYDLNTEERLEWVSYSGILERTLSLIHNEIQSRKSSS